MIQIYIDAEFDAVRYKQHFEQAVISMGAVICIDGKEVDQFYRLVKPTYFKRLSKVVKKMTHLCNEDIMEAEPLEIVSEEFKVWLMHFGNIEQMYFYSCGPDDRRTLLKNCEIHHIDGTIFDRIIDLQKLISAGVFYEGKLVSSTLSLDDMKLIYDVFGLVEHNALTDAVDLMQIHQRFLKGNHQNQEQIKAIVERKERKALLSKQKQKERLKMMMHKLFSNYSKDFIMITLTPEVIKQFQLWENKEKESYMHWKRSACSDETTSYNYAHLNVFIKINLDADLPEVGIRFLYHGFDMVRTYPLNYRNASYVENILKMGAV